MPRPKQSPKIAVAEFTVGARQFRKGDEVTGRALDDVLRVRPDLVTDPKPPNTSSSTKETV